MDFKTFIFVLIPLIASQVQSLPCDQFKRDQVFTCNNVDKQVVTIFDQDHHCGSGSICNKNYVDYQTACSPCIPTSVVCGTAFKCSNATSFKMGLSEFLCPKATVCNQEKLTSCEPCIPQNCDHSAWTCDPKDETKVTIGSLVITCPKLTVCNSEYVSPCEPCIAKKASIFSNQTLKKYFFVQ